MTQTLLITGANRGIGLEYVRQYLDDGWKVIACCRQPGKADELQSLAEGRDCEIRALDVTDFAAVAKLGEELAAQPIDLLINNAGISGHSNQQIDNIDPDNWHQVFTTNTMAPLMMVRALLPSLKKGQGKTIANMTSKMGSVADNESGGSYIYRSSKAALNAVSMSLARDLEEDGIKVISLHPGWVETDMGGPNALIDTHESVRGLRKVIAGQTLRDSGAFRAYDGAGIPW